MENKLPQSSYERLSRFIAGLDVDKLPYYRNEYFDKFIKKFERPTVPQYVADWFEENKGYLENSLYRYSANCYNGNFSEETDFSKWFSVNTNNPIETLIKMKLFGYEIKGEPVGTISIDGVEGVLKMSSTGKIMSVGSKDYTSDKVEFTFEEFEDFRASLSWNEVVE